MAIRVRGVVDMRTRRVRVSALLLVAALLAPESTYADYNGTCLNDNNLHGYIDFTTATHLNYVTGEVQYLRDVLACTTFLAGATHVLPTNLQGNAFVQLGYGRTRPSAVLDWQYTPSDSSGGDLHNLTFSHTKPILGHRYSLRISWSSIASAWQNYVNDITANSGTLWQDTTNNHSYGTETWYGFEINEFNDQFGGQGSGAKINLQNLGYRPVGGSTTTYVATTTVHNCCGSLWSYYHDGAFLDSSNSNRTVIWAYTDNH
jgi:hypothetical protein